MSTASPEMTLPLAHDPAFGLFGPGSRMWLINRDALLLGAGPAALLLQLAHPLVAEGVAAHSGFEAEPFARLRRTLETTMRIVFGDMTSARSGIERLGRIHASATGPVHDPVARSATGKTGYSALEPALLLWVQATLVITGVRAYRRWVGPLEDEDAAVHWQEQRALGEQLGIPRAASPRTYVELLDWFHAQLGPAGPVTVTPTARRLAAPIVRPPFRYLPGPVVDVMALPGLSLLPTSVRDGYGIAWSPARQRLADALSLGVRAWSALVPRSWHSMPQARAADRRVRARGLVGTGRSRARPATHSATIDRIPNRSS